MTYSIMLINLGQRRQNAAKVQEILTKHGCAIRTRLGIHEVGNVCAESGLVILDLVAEAEELKALEADLNSVDGITAKLVQL